MVREIKEVENDARLKIVDPKNKNDDVVYDQIILTLSKLPDDIYDRVIKEVTFIQMGVYGRYWKLGNDFDGVIHHIEINSIGLNDKTSDEIQGVIAHEIAHYVLGHHGFNPGKLPQVIEDEADNLAIEWGFDKEALEKLKYDFHEIIYHECEICGESINFEFTYFNGQENKRICHDCVRKLVSEGNKIEDMFLDYDKMRFKYNDKKI